MNCFGRSFSEETEKAASACMIIIHGRSDLEATAFVRQNKKAAYHLYNSINRQDMEKYLYYVTGEIMMDFVQKQEVKIR